MPARTIHRSHRSVTGTVALLEGPQPVESRLEADFLLLLAFEPRLLKVETQPFTIRFVHDGKARRYTPDVRAWFHDIDTNRYGAPCCVFEVKYYRDLKANWADYRPSFEAARDHCRGENAVFRIITDRHVYGTRLDNCRLLDRCRGRPPELTGPLKERIYMTLGARRDMTIGELIGRLAGMEPWRARSFIHYLIRARWLRVDMDLPLNDDAIVLNTEMAIYAYSQA